MPSYQGSDGRWRYRFTLRGERFSGSAPKGSNTKRVADRLESEHADKASARVHTGKMPTVKEFAPRFLEHQAARTKPLTQMNQRATVKNLIIPILGRHRMDAVEQHDIDMLATTWSAAGLAPKTINVRLGCLRRMFSLAVDWNLIPRVPKIRFLKVVKTHPRFLTEDEAARLIASSDDTWRSMLFIALRTGLRVGELRGLHWADVDLDRSVITVRRTDPGKPGMAATAPKGGADRKVPLSPEAVAALQALPRDVERGPWVWPGAPYKRRGPAPRSEKGCFHGLHAAMGRAKITGIGWHTLRHTYASWLVMRAVPLRVVQQYLGHSSIVQTERYSHLSPDFGHASVALLDVPMGSQGAAKALPAGPENPKDSVEIRTKGR